MFQAIRRSPFLLLFILLTLLACMPLAITSTPEPVSSPPLETVPPVEPSATPTTGPQVPTGLNASGPYVIFSGQAGIWITNPDGGFPTQLTEQETDGDLRHAISPDGKRLAYVTRADQGFDLVIIRIPGGETENTIRLMDITPEEEMISDSTPSSSKAFASVSIQRYDSLAWQPGSGQSLAFMGAINGPTADLYLLDTQTWEITQLTDGPSQAIMPTWSPDGQHILHYGVSWVPPFGGAIVGPNRLDGVWAVDASTGEVITLPGPKGVLPNFVGWQDATHYLTFDSDDECYAQDLRSVDVASGEITPVMAASFYYHIAQSPENGALLFSSAGGCESSLGDGVFILLPGQDDPIKIHEKKAYQIDWLPESRVFQAYPQALFSPDGGIRYDPPVYEASYNPAVSSYGYEAWEVIENQQGRVVVNLPGSDWRTIFEGSIDQLIWSPTDGNLLLIAARDGSLYTAAYPDFTPRLMGNLAGRIGQAVWSP